jgi:hypothetical protein
MYAFQAQDKATIAPLCGVFAACDTTPVTRAVYATCTSGPVFGNCEPAPLCEIQLLIVWVADVCLACTSLPLNKRHDIRMSVLLYRTEWVCAIVLCVKVNGRHPAASCA